jgi:outer membrane protein
MTLWMVHTHAWIPVDEHQPRCGSGLLRFSRFKQTTKEEAVMNKTITAAVLAAMGMSGGTALAADDSAQWILRVGAHYVEPAADNHDLVTVEGAQTLTFNLTRMIDDHWAVELLAALPFEHDIALNDGGKVADVKQLPPTLSLQYHFVPGGDFRPYLGAGLNATIFFEEDTAGPLAGADLKLGTSYGPALQAGFDFDIGDTWFLNFDARWIDIDTRATLSGTSLGTVNIDPITYGLSFGRSF